MARLGSTSRGGYFPTPLSELSFISSRVTVAEAGQPVNIFDPCCGTGEALAVLGKSLQQQGAQVSTYGVELEKSRAEEAFSTLDHVIHDGCEVIRTEEKFSLLFLNPPYQDGFGERVETSFLRRQSKYLQESGILIFLVPQATLHDASAVIGSKFSDVRVYRFTDAHFDTFKQVVLFGRYKKPDTKERNRTMQMLETLAKLPPDELDTINLADQVSYELHPSEPVTLFRGGMLSDHELLQDVQNSEAFQQTIESFENRSFTIQFSRPVLEMKPMHYAAAIASNVISGNMGNHILVGGTRKVILQKDIENDDGDTTGQAVTEYHKSRIRIFSPQGIFDLE